MGDVCAVNHGDTDHYGFEMIRTLPAIGKSELPPNAICVGHPTEFSQLEAADKNLLIYPWQPSARLATTLQRLPFAQLPQTDVTLPLSSLAQPLHRSFSPLAQDILHELAPCCSTLATLARATRLRLTFGTATDQMCPIFHVDRLSLRMICTLRGPGTEWLDDRHVVRGALGKGVPQAIVSDDAVVYQLGLWQVAIFKGDKYPGAYRRGLVHRSPAVPAGCDGRAYLRIDALY